MSLDKALLLRKLAELDGYHAPLQEFCDISDEDCRRQWKTQRIVDRTLQLIVECCSDLANHNIAAKGFPIPPVTRMLSILAAGGVLSSELGETMARTARFGNILVH